MHWHLAQLKSNGLRQALLNLARQGFATFVPFERRTERVGNRFRTAEKPVFPGYLFVKFDPGTDRWQKINSTLGISRLVSFGNRPAPVPDDLMDGLIVRFAKADAHLPDLKAGDEVTVRCGPFAEFLGNIEAVDANRRILLLIDVMGRNTRLTLHADQLGHRSG